MIRFIENKKENSLFANYGAGFTENRMVRRRVAEVTNYSDILLTDAADRLVTEAKGKSIRCHHGHLAGSSFMEANYSLIKVSGGELRFLDPRNLDNRMSIYFRDVIKAEIGEDPEIDYVSFKFYLKDKTFISVVPMN